MSVTCGRSVVCSGYSFFLHQLNWLPQYGWSIVESGTKHHNPKPIFSGWSQYQNNIDNQNLFLKMVIFIFFKYWCIKLGKENGISANINLLPCYSRNWRINCWSEIQYKNLKIQKIGFTNSFSDLDLSSLRDWKLLFLNKGLKF